LQFSLVYKFIYQCLCDLTELSKVCVDVQLQFTEDTAGRKCKQALAL